MARSSLPSDRRAWLLGELADWQTRGIVTAGQTRQILDSYETDEEAGTRRRSLAVFVLMGMAALLFGLAVLLVIGFNWDAVPAMGKLALVVAAVVATHALAFYLRFHKQLLRVSEVVFFLACLLYGAGIWLVAQAFHLDAHYPDGVWWWVLGVLPFALCLESLLLHSLAVFLLGSWAGMEVLGFAQMGPMFSRVRLPNGAYTLPLLALPGLIWAARRASVVGVGLYVPLFAWWLVLQSFAWDGGPRVVFWIGTLGAGLLILAEAHRSGNAMAIPYRLWGVALSAGALVALSSYHFWRMEMRYSGPLAGEFAFPVELVTMVEFLLFGAVVVGALVLFMGARRRSNAGAGAVELSRLWFPIGLAICFFGMALWSLIEPSANDPALYLPPVVLANLAMLGMALYLVRVGTREERVRPLAFGVLYFLIWAFARYLDLFADAGGMLGAAALFFLCAIAMVVIARFWSKTREAHQEHEPEWKAEPIDVGPRWFDRVAAWMGGRSRGILLGAAALHVVVLVGMIAAEGLPLVVGDRVLLRVRPVDPRDLFRGDYVVLGYDVEGGWNVPNVRAGMPVYAKLEAEPDGKHWRIGHLSSEPPTGKYLRGRYTGRVEFGIEAYYVQEGKGLEWERLRNARQLSAEVAVSPWGKAKLVRLVPDP